MKRRFVRNTGGENVSETLKSPNEAQIWMALVMHKALLNAVHPQQTLGLRVKRRSMRRVVPSRRYIRGTRRKRAAHIVICRHPRDTEKLTVSPPRMNL